MNTAIKIWLIVAAAFVVLGGLVFASVMMANNWQFNKMATVSYETNTYEFEGEITNISINTNTADIVFLPSADGKAKLICYEEENIKHSVSVSEGALNVSFTDERKWYENIGVHFGNSKLTLYLPEREYGSLVITSSTGDVDIGESFKFESIDIELSTGDVDCNASTVGTFRINTTTGDISLNGVSASSIELFVTTGHIELENSSCSGELKVTVDTGRSELENVRCQSFVSTGDTGDITIEEVIVEGKLSIVRDTGDVWFEECDAGEIFIKTSTGDVRGDLLTSKIFITESSTGRIRVPESTEGGKCSVKTSTGDIIINIGK